MSIIASTIRRSITKSTSSLLSSSLLSLSICIKWPVPFLLCCCYFLAIHNQSLCNSFQFLNTIQSTKTISDVGQQQRRKLSSSLQYYSKQQSSSSSSSLLILQSSLDPSSFFTDEEWHPNDPAYTTPQLLVGIWDQIAMAKTLTKGETMTVLYPQMVEEFTPKYLNLLFAHLDSCKDVCDHFGISTVLVPYKQKGKVVGFTVKSFKSPSSTKDNEDNYNFKYDPFWDDGTDFESLYSGVDDEDIKADPYPAIINKIPNDDDEIISITKNWVSAVMTDMGICPFTQGADTAGLPIGNVFYCVDRSTGFEDIYAKYWKEVVRVERNTEKDIATTLLITPEFCIDNVELFDSFTATLTQPLVGLKIEDLLQLVFFHPDWSFRDGSARTDTSSGKAANYARRSPWPMINILRTKQVRAAQKGIPTGLVYKQNEKTLSKIGVDKLETMLRLRDWTDTSEYKVNRREYDALKIAQDYQNTGTVNSKDTNLYDDTTPAANKVNKQQVEQGNLVNVMIQALEKRLGKSSAAVATTTVVPLSGPETSATAMATDVLIQELLEIAKKSSSSTISSPIDMSIRNDNNNNRNNDNDEEIPIDILLARKKRLEDARRALLDENEPISQSRSQFGQTPDPLTDAMYGTGGIVTKQQQESSVDDELFSDGMDTRSFY